jgi:hypothetical protein
VYFFVKILQSSQHAKVVSTLRVMVFFITRSVLTTLEEHHAERADYSISAEMSGFPTFRA